MAYYCLIIALDKFLGVYPIDIGEALRRVLGKVVALATCADLEELCGTDQLYSGLQAVTVWKVLSCCSRIFDLNCNAGWGLLLFTAKNAFNYLYRMLLYGMLESCGHVVYSLCLIPIMAMLLYIF